MGRGRGEVGWEEGGEKWDEGEKKEEVKRERSGMGRGVGWGIGSGGRREEWAGCASMVDGGGMNLRVCSLF